MTVKAIRGTIRITPHLTFTGGSYEANYPLSNIKQLPLSKVARTTGLDLADTQFQASSALAYRGQLSVIIAHNLSRDGKIRRRYYSGENLTGDLQHDSGWVKWLDSVYSVDEVDWDGGNFYDRTYTDAELEGTTWDHPYFVEDTFYWKSVLVEFDDQENPAGYLQFGLSYFAVAEEFLVNFGFDSEYGYLLRTLVEEAEGGALYFERRDKPRVFEGTINYAKNTHAKGIFLESQRQDDIEHEFYFWPNREDTLNRLRDAFLARNVDLGRLSYQAAARSRIPIFYKEVIG